MNETLSILDRSEPQRVTHVPFLRQLRRNHDTMSMRVRRRAHSPGAGASPVPVGPQWPLACTFRETRSGGDGIRTHGLFDATEAL